MTTVRITTVAVVGCKIYAPTHRPTDRPQESLMTVGRYASNERRTNRRAIAMMFVCLSVCLERACIVIIRCPLARVLLYGWIVQCPGPLTPTHVRPLPAVFFQFYLE